MGGGQMEPMKLLFVCSRNQRRRRAVHDITEVWKMGVRVTVWVVDGFGALAAVAERPLYHSRRWLRGFGFGG